MKQLGKKVLSLVLLIGLVSSCIFLLITEKTTSVSADSNTFVMADLVDNSKIDLNASGLGRGINAVNAKSVGDYNKKNYILKPDALAGINVNKLNKRSSSIIPHSSTDIYYMLDNYVVSEMSDGAFIKPFEDALNNSANFNYKDYQYKYYYGVTQKYCNFNLYLASYRDKHTYKNAYSDGYLNDLNKVKNGMLKVEDFFGKYGTHLIGSAEYGGMMFMNYSIVSNVIREIGSLTNIVPEKFDCSKSDNVNSMEIINEVNNRLGTDYDWLYDIDSAFYISAIGGDYTFSSNVLNGFFIYNKDYEKWSNTLWKKYSAGETDNFTNNVLIGYGSEGLVPLWEILPDEYSDLAHMMETEYNNEVTNKKAAFIDEFKTGDYEKFNGGLGTEEDPYRISDVMQLLEIRSTDMNAHYVLENDIYLDSNRCVPIGGYSNNNKFCGVFDGQNHKIFNMKFDGDIVETDNRSYYGFFACIGKGGVLKNLSFENVDINITGPKVNNRKTRSFIGVAAGAVDGGTIENVTVNSGKFEHRACTNGMVFAGGIVGNARDAVIRDCTNRINIHADRYSAAVGGIAGYLCCSGLYNCTNYGNLEAQGTGWGGKIYASGIAGTVYEEEKECYFGNCLNYGNVTSKFYPWGFFGEKKSNDLYCNIKENLK